MTGEVELALFKNEYEERMGVNLFQNFTGYRIQTLERQLLAAWTWKRPKGWPEFMHSHLSCEIFRKRGAKLSVLGSSEGHHYDL